MSYSSLLLCFAFLCLIHTETAQNSLGVAKSLSYFIPRFPSLSGRQRDFHYWLVFSPRNSLLVLVLCPTRCHCSKLVLCLTGTPSPVSFASGSCPKTLNKNVFNLPLDSLGKLGWKSMVRILPLSGSHLHPASLSLDSLASKYVQLG